MILHQRSHAPEIKLLREGAVKLNYGGKKMGTFFFADSADYIFKWCTLKWVNSCRLSGAVEITGKRAIPVSNYMDALSEAIGSLGCRCNGTVLCMHA